MLGDARAASVRDVWTGRTITQLRDGSERRRIEVLRRLPAEAAAEERRGAARRGRSTRGRCRRGCTSSARPPATSPAPRRAARRKPASRARARPACSTSICSAASSTKSARRSSASTSSTTARRSCTSAPSRCASTSRRAFPHIYLYTSTNGLAFSEAQARRLVHSGIDEVTFSIDGATPESYVKYRQRGRFDVAIANLRAMADEKRRAGRDLPFLNWRYILFKWNDSDEEMNARAGAGRRDRRRSPLLGADRSSRERVLAAVRARLAGARGDPARDLGRQQPRQRHSRRDAARAHRRADARAGRAADRAGRPAAAGPDARPQPVDARRSRRRRPTAGGSSASARSSAPPTARCSTATSRARGCRRRSARATGRRARSRSRRPEQPGRYALKFDLVSEGIDWFERCGSPTTTTRGTALALR